MMGTTIVDMIGAEDTMMIGGRHDWRQRTQCMIGVDNRLGQQDTMMIGIVGTGASHYHPHWNLPYYLLGIIND